MYCSRSVDFRGVFWHLTTPKVPLQPAKSSSEISKNTSDQIGNSLDELSGARKLAHSVLKIFWNPLPPGADFFIIAKSIFRRRKNIIPKKYQAFVAEPQACRLLTHNSPKQKIYIKSTEFGFFFIDIEPNTGFQGYQVAENRELVKNHSKIMKINIFMISE